MLRAPRLGTSNLGTHPRRPRDRGNEGSADGSISGTWPSTSKALCASRAAPQRLRPTGLRAPRAYSRCSRVT
eukprot:6665379-Prymnesium_polylepis.1